MPEGAKLMEIVPQNEALINDAQMPTELIERIKSGQLIDVKILNNCVVQHGMPVEIVIKTGGEP